MSTGDGPLGGNNRVPRLSHGRSFLQTDADQDSYRGQSAFDGCSEVGDITTSRPCTSQEAARVL